jgi:hypothetical protein
MDRYRFEYNVMLFDIYYHLQVVAGRFSFVFELVHPAKTTTRGAAQRSAPKGRA